MPAQIKGVLFTEQAGDSGASTEFCFFLLWSPFYFHQTSCRQSCQQHAYLMLVDPTAAGPEIGLCLPVLPSGWCSPRDPQGEGSRAAGALCRLRRASSLPRGWAEVSFLSLVWHCCVHCLSSSWLGSFRHLTLWFLVFQHLAATPLREAGEGLFGGDGIRQWLRLEDAVPS